MTNGTSITDIVEAPARPPFSMKRLGEQTESWLAKLDLPQMKKPTGLGREYEFPTDLGALNNYQLGQMQLQLTAWYTYTLGVIGKEEADLGAYDEVYDVRLGLAMDKEEKAHDKRVLKEVVRALAIHMDDTLNALHRQLIERRHRLKRLQVQSTIYHEQLIRLSREQSRREMEAGVTR